MTCNSGTLDAYLHYTLSVFVILLAILSRSSVSFFFCMNSIYMTDFDIGRGVELNSLAAAAMAREDSGIEFAPVRTMSTVYFTTLRPFLAVCFRSYAPKFRQCICKPSFPLILQYNLSSSVVWDLQTTRNS